MPFRIVENHPENRPARSILSQTSGFIAEAGFTHSLTPARNCTYGCSYCYVPTMRIQAGLRREDWLHWGEATTFKANAAELVRKRSGRGGEIVYCSPVVDPWQPAELEYRLMPGLLEALTERPPALIAFQTRSPNVLTDLPLLRKLAARTEVRVSFSITTDRDEIRRIYEPHCESNYQRLEAIRELTRAGIRTFPALAPLLPCDPDRLIHLVTDATPENVIGDPLHVRETKRSGATTREAARRIAEHHGHLDWFRPEFQTSLVDRLRAAAAARGRRFSAGPEGFSWLCRM